MFQDRHLALFPGLQKQVASLEHKTILPTNTQQLRSVSPGLSLGETQQPVAMRKKFNKAQLAMREDWREMMCWNPVLLLTASVEAIASRGKYLSPRALAREDLVSPRANLTDMIDQYGSSSDAELDQIIDLS